jgi:hypothetical protein
MADADRGDAAAVEAALDELLAKFTSVPHGPPPHLPGNFANARRRV